MVTPSPEHGVPFDFLDSHVISSKWEAWAWVGRRHYIGNWPLSLTAMRSHVLFSGPCSKEETELAEPGQAAVA